VKRRAHNTGSIYRRRTDGRWAAQLNLGVVGGKRTRRTYSGATQQEVVAKLSVAEHALRRSAALPLERQTLAAFVEKWLEAVHSSLREPTFRRYQSLLKYAVSSLGTRSVAKLQPVDLQRLYDERLQSGAAPRTVLHLHRVIHRCLRDAERWGDAARNVSRLVDAPKVTRPEIRALNAEEARILLRAADGDRLEALLMLALATGMRQGELLGLTWRALDSNVAL
jgi:integrase